MPCRDEQYTMTDVLQARNDEMARLLCGVCKHLEANREMGNQPADLRAWWENHKRMDADRQKLQKVLDKQEKIKKDTLAKLTREERNALGFV